MLGVIGDEAGEVAHRAIELAGVAEAPAALEVEVSPHLLGQGGGVDLVVGGRGAGEGALVEEGLGLHQAGDVQPRMGRLSLGVDVDEGVHLARDVRSVDLVEAAEAAVVCLEPELGDGGEALGFEKLGDGLVVALQLGEGLPGHHVDLGLELALLQELPAPEELGHLVVIARLEAHLHQGVLGAGLVLGVEPDGVEGLEEEGLGLLLVAELGGRDAGSEQRFGALLGSDIGLEKHLELLEGAVVASPRGVELPDREAGVVAERVGRVVDDPLQAGDGLVALAGPGQAAGLVVDRLVAQVGLHRFARGDLEVGGSLAPLLPVVELGGQAIGALRDPLARAVARDHGPEDALGLLHLPGEEEGHPEVVPGRLGDLPLRAVVEVLAVEGNRHLEGAPALEDVLDVAAVVVEAGGPHEELRVVVEGLDDPRNLPRGLCGARKGAPEEGQGARQHAHAAAAGGAGPGQCHGPLTAGDGRGAWGSEESHSWRSGEWGVCDMDGPGNQSRGPIGGTVCGGLGAASW